MSSFSFKNLEALANQIHVQGEEPGGVKNNVNLAFTTVDEFFAGTLEVYLGGDRLCPEDVIESVDLKSFTLVLTPNDPGRLGSPPDQFERMVVDYLKNIKCG